MLIFSNNQWGVNKMKYTFDMNNPYVLEQLIFLHDHYNMTSGAYFNYDLKFKVDEETHELYKFLASEGLVDLIEKDELNYAMKITEKGLQYVLENNGMATKGY